MSDLVECPDDSCSQTFLRENMDRHTTQVHGYGSIVCSYCGEAVGPTSNNVYCSSECQRKGAQELDWDEKEEEIRNALEGDATLVDLAQKYSVKRKTFSTALPREYDWYQSENSFADYNREELIQAYEESGTVAVAAKEVGISKTQAHRKLTDWGVHEVEEQPGRKIYQRVKALGENRDLDERPDGDDSYRDYYSEEGEA